MVSDNDNVQRVLLAPPFSVLPELGPYVVDGVVSINHCTPSVDVEVYTFMLQEVGVIIWPMALPPEIACVRVPHARE